MLLHIVVFTQNYSRVQKSFISDFTLLFNELKTVWTLLLFINGYHARLPINICLKIAQNMLKVKTLKLRTILLITALPVVFLRNSYMSIFVNTIILIVRIPSSHRMSDNWKVYINNTCYMPCINILYYFFFLSITQTVLQDENFWLQFDRIFICCQFQHVDGFLQRMILNFSCYQCHNTLQKIMHNCPICFCNNIKTLLTSLWSYLLSVCEFLMTVKTALRMHVHFGIINILVHVFARL